MSLINDALKRAKQAQRDTPPPHLPAPHFRPVEPAPAPSRHGVGILLPLSLAAVALLTLLLLWELARRDNSSEQVQPKAVVEVAARSLPAPGALPTRLPSTTPDPVSPAVTNTGAPSKAVAGKPIERGVAAPEQSTSPNSTPATVSLSTNLIASSSDTPDTNRATSTAPAVPEPIPLKLQGIVFNPRRPSAMINGRIMFVGDRIRDLRLAAIRPGDVLLIGAGRTNLLSLEP